MTKTKPSPGANQVDIEDDEVMSFDVLANDEDGAVLLFASGNLQVQVRISREDADELADMLTSSGDGDYFNDLED